MPRIHTTHSPTGHYYIPGDISYFATFKVFILTEIEIILIWNWDSV